MFPAITREVPKDALKETPDGHKVITVGETMAQEIEFCIQHQRPYRFLENQRPFVAVKIQRLGAHRYDVEVAPEVVPVQLRR